MSYISLMLSPVDLSAIKPDWSKPIIDCRTFLILLAIQHEAILYETLSKDIGLQFFYIFFLNLFCFGTQVINPSFCVIDNSF